MGYLDTPCELLSKDSLLIGKETRTQDQMCPRFMIFACLARIIQSYVTGWQPFASKSAKLSTVLMILPSRD